MSQKLKNKDVCQQTGCSHRQLQYWEKKGYLKPSFGPRNIRLYTPKDLELIKKIIELKKRGKTLGEAYVYEKNETPIKTLSVSINSAPFDINKINELTGAYLDLNTKMIELLDKIKETEAEIPSYPYSIYNQENLNTLKEYQEKANQLFNHKNVIYSQIKKHLKPQIINNKDNLQKDSPKKEMLYSVDQLVLLHMKHTSNYDASVSREYILNKIKEGISVEQLAKDLRANH